MRQGAAPGDGPTEHGRRLRIAAAINARYVLPARVMLTSLLERLSGPRPVLYLFHGGLPREALEAIAGLVETHPIDCSKGLDSLPDHPGFPPEAAAPLLLAAELPAEVDRVLFLDADMLVLDDLTRLRALAPKGTVLSACVDMAIPTCGSARGIAGHAALGIPSEAPYFNAGVLLIDLDAWREREVTARAFDYLARAGDRASFFHQEAMNAVLWNDWTRLPARWNVLGGLAGRPLDRDGPEAWRDPAIVHYAGRFKPWKMRIGGRFDEPYRAALARIAPGDEGNRDGSPLLSWYDRRLRDRLYPLERLAWKAGLV